MNVIRTVIGPVRKRLHVDIGDMPREVAEAYIRAAMARHRVRQTP